MKGEKKGEGQRQTHEPARPRAHILEDQRSFSENESHLWGYPKLTWLLTNLKYLPVGEAEGCVCQRANGFCHPRCRYQLGEDLREKRKGSGGRGREIFLRARLTGWLGIQP